MTLVEAPRPGWRATVVRVLDAITLDLVTDPDAPVPSRFPCRLGGVDTADPEDPDPEQRRIAALAKDFTEVLVLGEEVAVRCTGVRDADGRALALVHWRDPEGSWSNLNADLVENGLAAWKADEEEPEAPWR